MKWLFTLLLLANLVILGWGVQRDPERVELPKLRPGVGHLQLLSEVEGRSSESTDRELADMPVPEAPVTEVAPGVMAEEKAPVQKAPAAQEESPDSLTESPDPDGVPVVAKSKADAAALVAQEAATPKTPGPVVQLCGAFGPFERGTEARALADSLASQGMDTSLRHESMEKPIGYWVMILPLESQEAAIEKVRQLRASGIEDIRRFVKGDQRNGISLGVFSTKKNAQSRQQAIAKKGHSSSVVPRLVTVPAFWVDYRADEEKVTRAAARIGDNQGGIKNEQYPCPRVVTSGGIF